VREVSVMISAGGLPGRGGNGTVEEGAAEHCFACHGGRCDLV
jgi:hypothetical protein